MGILYVDILGLVKLSAKAVPKSKLYVIYT